MQIKINFDQIFHHSNPIHHLHQNNFEPYQCQDSESHSSSHQKFKMNINIFEDSLAYQQKYQHEAHKIPTLPINNSQICEKIPGERLYYESKDYIDKKNKQLERIRRQKVMEEQQQNTFKPKINKNTQKILNNKIKNQQTIKKIKSSELIPTKIKKQQEEYTHCTFKPQLISKYSSKTTYIKQKNSIFQSLYNHHKIKQNKLKLKVQSNHLNNQAKSKTKKFNSAQFEQFLMRNNQFIHKVQKKHQLVISASKLFDLQTGNKLFSPKINTIKSHKNYFSHRTELKTASFPQQFSPIRLQIKPKGIFSKNSDQQQSLNLFQPSQWSKIPSTVNINQIQQDEQQQKSQKASRTSFGKHDELTLSCSSKLQPKVNESSRIQKNDGDNEVHSTKDINSRSSTPENKSLCKSEGNAANQFF